MKRALLSACFAAPLLAVTSCTGGSSSVPSTTCATTADCPPGTVCTTPSGRCVQTPDNEFIGTFRCYVASDGQSLTPDELGGSEVEGSYQGTALNLLAFTACTAVTVGNQMGLLVETKPVPDTAGDVTGLEFLLSWSDAQAAPVDIQMAGQQYAINSGALMASADGGLASAIATVTNVGFVHLDQAPSVGQWLTGYIDAPVR